MSATHCPPQSHCPQAADAILTAVGVSKVGTRANILNRLPVGSPYTESAVQLPGVAAGAECAMVSDTLRAAIYTGDILI